MEFNSTPLYCLSFVYCLWISLGLWNFSFLGTLIVSSPSAFGSCNGLGFIVGSVKRTEGVDATTVD